MADIKQSPQAKGSENRPLVFIIEDERAVLKLLSKLLQVEGYRVVEALDGKTARSVWDKNKSEVDLLITDLMMPNGVNGKELAIEFLQEKPTLNVIFSSGYDLGDVEDNDFSALRGAQFIQKPFDPGTLLNMVKKSLEKV